MERYMHNTRRTSAQHSSQYNVCTLFLATPRCWCFSHRSSRTIRYQLFGISLSECSKVIVSSGVQKLRICTTTEIFVLLHVWLQMCEPSPLYTCNSSGIQPVCEQSHTIGLPGVPLQECIVACHTRNGTSVF